MSHRLGPLLTVSSNLLHSIATWSTSAELQGRCSPPDTLVRACVCVCVGVCVTRNQGQILDLRHTQTHTNPGGEGGGVKERIEREGRGRGRQGESLPSNQFGRRDAEQRQQHGPVNAELRPIRSLDSKQGRVWQTRLSTLVFLRRETPNYFLSPSLASYVCQ